MHHITIPDNSYGEATVRLRDTIDRCQSIKWFVCPMEERSLIGYLSEQIQYLFARISNLMQKAPPKSALSLLEGDWSLLHQNRSDFDPYYPGGHRFDEYTRALASAACNAKSMITSSPLLHSIIKPPLWPITGNPDISGTPLIAYEEVFRLSGLDVHYDSIDWRVAWGLLCQAEYDVQNHLLYDVIGDASASMNLFTPLLNIYAAGCFPLGWDNLGFYVFCYRK